MKKKLRHFIEDLNDFGFSINEPTMYNFLFTEGYLDKTTVQPTVKGLGYLSTESLDDEPSIEEIEDGAMGISYRVYVTDIGEAVLIDALTWQGIRNYDKESIEEVISKEL